jgi:hypothetical protein
MRAKQTGKTGQINQHFLHPHREAAHLEGGWRAAFGPRSAFGTSHFAFGIWHLAFGITRQFSSEPSLKATSLALAYHIASNRTAFLSRSGPQVSLLAQDNHCGI